MATEFPTRGQKAPQFWDEQLKAYIDESDEDAVKKPGARKAFQPLSSPLSTSAAGVTDFSFRTLTRLSVPTGRWRVGFANRNLRSATTLTTPCTITGVFIGTPTYATTAASGARWNGGATGPLTSVSGALTVPVDGSAVYTPWITAGGSQFTPGSEKIIGWGHTSANSGNGYGSSTSGYQTYYAAGSSNAAAATLPSGTLSTIAYLDIFIEYEFSTPGQIGLFVGDSNLFGVATSAPALFPTSGVGALPHEAWPAVAGELANFAPVNLGVGSTTLQDFAVTYPGLWTRFDLNSTVFDFATVSLGTNGLSSSPGNFDNYVTWIRGINTILRALGIKRIYWTDITPRGLATSASTLSTAVAAGATTFQTPAVLSFNDGQAYGVLGSDTNGELFQVTSTTPTGSGPYTYTLTAPAAFAHPVGDVVTSGTEAARRRINAWLRGMPDGISGLIPFERAFEASPQSPLADPRLVCADGLHFSRGAGMSRAAQAVNAGVAPKLS